MGADGRSGDALLASCSVAALISRATDVTSRQDVERYPYQPSRIVESVTELVDELEVPA